MATAVRRALDPALVRELSRQNAELAPSPARQAHLDELARPEAGVVVTGQQVGLFLGPAYSIYKAATAIAEARRLRQAQGQPTVPVFWLQSEDHDADEVSSCHVLSDGELVEVKLACEGAERASLAHRPLGERVEEALAQLADLLGNGTDARETLALLRRGYRPDRGWVDAFAQSMAELFADEGLVMLDPRTPAMASLAKPLHRRALERADAIDEALVAGADALERAGQPVGVAPRPGCSLSFYHPAGADGPRHRLTRQGDDWIARGMTEPRATADLLAELEREPLRFSTSGLLRVALQNHWLPVLCQIAGPGEARYLRQLPPLHVELGTPASAVVLRLRMVVTDARCRRRLSALGVKATDVDGVEPMLERLADGDPGIDGDDVRARLEAAVERELEAVAPELDVIDTQLQKALSKTRRHVKKGAAALGRRVDAARARNDTTRTSRVADVCATLIPGGRPQERVIGLPELGARHGVAAFKAAVMRAAEAHVAAPGDVVVEAAL